MLQLKYLNQLWTIQDKKPASVAEIYLDYEDQVNQVVLNTNASENDQLQVLRLVAHHTQKYVKNRSYPVMGGLMTHKCRNTDLSCEDSRRLMDFTLITEEIGKLSREEIIEGLKSIHIDVISAIHPTAVEAIKAAVVSVDVKSLSFQIIPRPMSLFVNELDVRFEVKKPNQFKFWKNESKPSKVCNDWDLHIVPSYHPVMNDWQDVGMVNGDTDAYIRGSAIRSIYCPETARSKTGKELLESTFTHVNHPYKAVGRFVTIRVISTYLRSMEGIGQLTEFLRGALNLNKKYISISGGFRAPLKCGHNRLLELNRTSPWSKADYSSRGYVARGSEQHCVWAYRVLAEEGVLDKSHVPSWFTKEGWLEIYKGAKMQPGLY